MGAYQSGKTSRIVLVLGSAPAATASRDWPRLPFTDIVAINNAWAVRPDWDFLIHPDDFPAARRPVNLTEDQRIVTSHDYVPVQNRYGGFVYADGTMAFTAGYWALGALRPSVLAFFGCDMVYPDAGPTHFYGTGAADPLRPDVTLRDLAAKSARLGIWAARQGCHAVNLSTDDTRLTLPRANAGDLHDLARTRPIYDAKLFEQAEAAERELAYLVPSGRYWEAQSSFDPAALARIDAIWRGTLDAA